MKSNDSYRTTDIYVASFLMLQMPAVQFTGMERISQKSKVFLFTPKQQAEEMAYAFVGGIGDVNARRMCDQIRMAKELVLA